MLDQVLYYLVVSKRLKRARGNIKTTASIWLIFHTPWNDATSWRCWVLNTSYVFGMYSFKSKNPSLFLWTINLNRTHTVIVRFLFGFSIRLVTSFTAQFKCKVDLLSSLGTITCRFVAFVFEFRTCRQENSYHLFFIPAYLSWQFY